MNVDISNNNIGIKFLVISKCNQLKQKFDINKFTQKKLIFPFRGCAYFAIERINTK